MGLEPDLTQLDDLSDQTILERLKGRYERDLIYVSMVFSFSNKDQSDINYPEPFCVTVVLISWHLGVVSSVTVWPLNFREMNVSLPPTEEIIISYHLLKRLMYPYHCLTIL